MHAAPSLPARLPAARSARFAGPAVDDALSAARWIVSSGRLVSLEHAAARPDDDAAALGALVDRVAAAGLASSCELLVRVDRLGVAAARGVVGAARRAGLGVVLAGPPAQVGPLAGDPAACVAVAAAEPGAEQRCRALAAGRVRLLSGRGAAADRAFVRCLVILLAGRGSPELATADPRLIAIAGERATWHGRAADSWEHLLPMGVRDGEQRRLVAAGSRVRVAVPSGAGNTPWAALGRRLGGRTWAR